MGWNGMEWDGMGWDELLGCVVIGVDDYIYFVKSVICSVNGVL